MWVPEIIGEIFRYQLYSGGFGVTRRQNHHGRVDLTIIEFLRRRSGVASRGVGIRNSRTKPSGWQSVVWQIDGFNRGHLEQGKLEHERPASVLGVKYTEAGNTNE